MISVTASSHYFRPVTVGTALPSLEADLKALVGEPLRRIDRFIQLALLGSARCAHGQVLQADCAVYLGSGLGPIGNTITVQQQLIRDHELPKPFNFVNTLGSSAGFHVARNLGLHGQNLFVSRRGASLETVLSAAMADLTLGAVAQALVGVVEEVTLPLEDHRRRQQWPATAQPAEGSDWWLLQTDERAGPGLELQRFEEFSGLENYLQRAWTANARLLCARQMDHDLARELRARFSGHATADAGNAWHDSLDAARVAEAYAGAPRGPVFLVSGAAECGWTLFRFGA